MRFLRAALVVAVAWSVSAQEPELPKADPAGTPLPRSSPPPELIPHDLLSPAERAAASAQPAPAPPSLPELDKVFEDKPISPAAEAAERRAQWRELRNRVANDADLRAAKRKADAARTDLEKRDLLRTYYEMYFGKMIALTSDSGLKTYLNDRKKEHLAGLPQPRVRPSPSPASAR